MSKPNQRPAINLLSFSIGVSGLFSALVLAVYGYLGTFSRHMADDFCSVGFTRTNFFAALWNNYLTVSDRFSNFALIALSESIWPGSVSILPLLMILLWVAGVAWLLHEGSHFAGHGWAKPTTLTLTVLLIFFALLQAPNRYQILYWRSSMATHFAPLVLLPSLAAFLLRSISRSSFSRWLYPLAFFLSFILGGFSEPTVVILIALLGFAIAATWLWMKTPTRRAALSLLTWSFAGAVIALIIMAIAPANSLRLGDPPPALLILILRSFKYTYQFIKNSFNTLPLPTIFTIFTPFLVFHGLYVAPAVELTVVQRKRIWVMLAVAPLLSFLLVLGSFAPSVYGQSFPVERARFAGQLILVATLMIEGAGLGVLFAQWRPLILLRLPVGMISASLLMISAIYPLRAVWLTLADVPEYRERAKLWDAREAYIHKRIALGEADLVVPGFPGIYGIKEWDDVESHWVNRCVADYYGVNTIRTVTVTDEYLQEFFSGQ
jgi:hypothetical protein